MGFKITFNKNLSYRKKLCPNCLNELKLESPLAGLIVPESYFCDKCGYSGSVALEVNQS
ncbi:MAG: hypothetical protein QW372_06260 [Nitrososphaerales archaeon]